MARITALGCSWNRPSDLFIAVTVLSAARSSTMVLSFIFDAQRLHLRDEPRGILGAGQFFLECMQPKTVVDALVQDAAQLAVALQNQNVLHAVLRAATAAASRQGRRR